MALQEHGFEELTTMEVLQTELKVTRRTVPVRDLSFLRHKVSKLVSLRRKFKVTIRSLKYFQTFVENIYYYNSFPVWVK